MIAYPIKIQCVCPNHPEPVLMYNDVLALKKTIKINALLDVELGNL